MSPRQRIRFYQQLAVLMRAGVSLRAGLQRLSDRLNSRQFALVLEKVNAGERLAEAFTAAGFTDFECHLVAAGERGGRLEEVFAHLAEYWTQQIEMARALRRPLYYPIIVLHLALIVGALVQAVISTWQEAVANMIFQLGGCYVLGIGFYLVLKLSWPNPAAQRVWLAIPLVGGLLSSAFAYRWITALRIEFQAGIPLSNAVGDAWRASGYVGSERLAVEGQEALRSGTSLSALVQSWRRLPRDWVDFIETGEVSGGLEQAFTTLEKEAAASWARAQQRMNEWMPKILYFVVLLVVGVQVALLGYHVLVEPISKVNSDVEKALNGG